MKKACWLITGLAAGFLLATAVTTYRESAVRKARSGERGELKSRNGEWQSRIESLEKPLGKLDEAAKKDPAPPVIISSRGPNGRKFLINNLQPLANDFADTTHPPKIWGEGECNGWKYYIIPLAANAEAAQPR